MTQDRPLVNLLLAIDRERTDCTSLAHWIPVWREAQRANAGRGPYLSAIAAALRSDRLAWAFFSGYQGAIQAAFPDQTRPGLVTALGVNESGRKITQIKTLLDREGPNRRLTGSKSWIVGGLDVQSLFILSKVSDGPTEGPGSMTMVHLPIKSQGVRRGRPRPQNVIPELPHTGVKFNAVCLAESQVIPGDGYGDYAKPFRTREDVFVTGCALAYLLAEARSGSWSTKWLQRCIAAITGLEACSVMDPRETNAHILTAGALSFAADVLCESEQLWLASQTSARERWNRDFPLLELGKEARKLRSIKAWQAVGQALERS
ncbi:hypothetical protein PMI15_01206 [Polaromonas sp. CF318]|nr:hypothetical protein PMI15_01206 [Polaromonas sp. CF318]